MSPATTAPETKQRVRHPLDAVRAHIRRYVLLETAAAVLLFLALWFWIGFFVDFGAFWTFAYDWVLELNFVDGGSASRAVRIGLAAIVLLGLAYVVVTRLFVRLFKEFSDPAVALVLERRFPKELGDRLITAVELADPKKAESYGFSGAMLAQTIDEAADRVERLPVADVFDWRRLRRRWFLVGFATVGLFFVAMGVNLIVQAARGKEASPTAYLWNFAHNASIWVERNILMSESYWLRNAQLELVRFQDSASHPGEMRVARDDSRPDLLVRTVAWVVPDARADGGWRALKVSEIADFVGSDSLNKIDIPADWPQWSIDLNDLDPKIPAGIVPPAWQGRPVSESRKKIADDPSLRATLDKAGALPAVAALGDWKTWTYDKLTRQLGEARPALEQSHPGALEAYDEVNRQLTELAAAPRMNRRLRKLETPKDVSVSFRGRTTKSSSDAQYKANQTFVVPLDGLKESVTFFARGGDAFTPPKQIALVPPPSVRTISIDKADPAYLYHRLAGSQAPLKGLKQRFPDVRISVTGETSALDVPLGANLKLHVIVDRPLKEGIRIVQAGQVRDPGVVVPDNPVTRDGDGLGFTVEFQNVVKTMEFLFEFHDEDNVKGKRKIRIRPIDDQSPEILNFELGVVLRKARSKDGSPTVGGALDGLLVTPDAILPLGGTVRDDVALVDVSWAFDVQPITIEPGSATKPGRIIVQASPGLRRGSVIVSALQYTSPLDVLVAPWYLNFVSRAVEGDVADKKDSSERSAPLAIFQDNLKAEEVETLDDVKRNSVGKPPRQKPFLREHVLKDHEFFSVKQQLPDLKTKDPKTQMQVFHSLKLWLTATDNNVETGPSTSRTRTPISFLVVPETELLAQVGFEEEALRDRLEKVQQKLKAAQTTIDAQLPTMKAAKADTDYALVALRVDEVRKALLDTGSATREIHADYSRILQELQVNRVKRDKISDVQTKIVLPLDGVVNATNGNFALLEDILQRLSASLDDDIANKKIVPNLPQHVKTGTLASEEIARLLREIEQILNAMSGGIDYVRLLDTAVNLLRDQQRVGQPLVDVQNEILRKLFRDLEPK